MNISRSGRVRKKSKFLTDDEFQTPKESVIYGLSSLESKVVSSSDVPRLEVQDEDLESMIDKNGGELDDPALSRNEKENSGEKPIAKPKLPRPYNNKSRRTNKKDIPGRRLGNACKNVDFVEHALKDFDSNDQKTGVKEQKYFIVVEETSSKSTEKLIFLVEEKPIQLKRSLQKSSKNTRKRPRVEAIKNSVIKSTNLSNENVTASNTHNRINAAESQISLSAMNGDIQSGKKMSASNISEVKVPNLPNKTHAVESKPLGYSLDDGESEVSSIQIITEERNNSESIPGESNVGSSLSRLDNTMYSQVQLTGTTQNNLNNKVQIIAMSHEESNSIIEGETIELVIPEGTDGRNIVTIETSKVHQRNK